MKSRIALVILVSLLLVNFFSCSLFGNDSTDSTDSTDSSQQISLSVSAGVNETADRGVAIRAVDIVSMDTEEYFKDNRKPGARGDRQHQLTPETFVLDIDAIVLYNEIAENEFDSTRIFEFTTNPDGGIIPKHINLAYADDFIRDVNVEAKTYDGLSMQFLPLGNGDSNDGYYVRSIIGIDLPSDYDTITLPNEITGIEGLSNNLHYFGFEDLQPFDTKDGFLSYLTIGSNITESGIQNPAGATTTTVNPVTETTGNAVSLYFSTLNSIDLSSYENPEVLFNWDLNNLVEIYDAGTLDNYSDDIVTFSLSNPFPLSLNVQENSEPLETVDQNDSTPPADVIAPAISGLTTYNTLQWINPTDKDFKEVAIVRKEGVEPTDMNDGTEVYRDYNPNYVDATGTSGVEYFYRIFTVDYAGNISNGVTLNQVQP